MQLAFVYKMHVNRIPLRFLGCPPVPSPLFSPMKFSGCQNPKEKFYPATRRFVRAYISVQPSHYYLPAADPTLFEIYSSSCVHDLCVEGSVHELCTRVLFTKLRIEVRQTVPCYPALKM